MGSSQTKSLQSFQYFPDLPRDMVYEVCNNMSLEDLGNAIRSSKQISEACKSLYIDRLYDLINNGETLIFTKDNVWITARKYYFYNAYGIRFYTKTRSYPFATYNQYMTRITEHMTYLKGFYVSLYETDETDIKNFLLSLLYSEFKLSNQEDFEIKNDTTPMYDYIDL